MNALWRSGKNRTFLRRRIADRNDGIEFLLFELRNRLGSVRGDVDPNFAHGFDSERADVSAGLASGAVHFVGVATKLAEQAFRHLAAHAIAGAQNKNAMRHGLVPTHIQSGAEMQKSTKEVLRHE